MSLQIGQQLSSYEITSLIGKGGMGEVYRARDTKLKRDVAIKILPDEFLRDTDRVSRFQREAESLAALNHQNIAAIYDVQQTDATRFLILEFVAGETLADILNERGALPVEEALEIAKQICGALEAAHEKGIVHRDLKPANVKITPDGKVKVLDFGLAKALENTPAGANLSHSPTLSMAATQAGMILGTAAYMSPEQAKGLAADARSDVFAFGCLLYEMLAGRQAFQGETASEILASVLVRDPDFKRLPPNLNPRLSDLVRRCLEKNPKRRWHCAGDLRIELETIASDPYRKPETVSQATPQRRHTRLWVAMAAGFLIAFGALAFVHFRETSTMDQVFQLSVALPENSNVAYLAVSPDGRQLVLDLVVGTQFQLWVRSLDSSQMQPLPGTDFARDPFWSPDGRWIGFFAGNEYKLKIVSATGGPPQVLCDGTGLGRGGTWNRDGVILFGSDTGPLRRVNATGGSCDPVTRTESGSVRGFPNFLPDGKHFLYTVTQGDEARRGIYLASLDDPSGRRLLTDVSSANFVPSSSPQNPGHILFLRNSALMALSFDARSLEPAGDAFQVASEASNTYTPAELAASAATNGVLVYIANRTQKGQLAWFDRAGKEIGKVGAPADTAGISLSPDGQTVATSRRGQGLWLRELLRDAETRFTFPPLAGGAAVWSPDGLRIAFSTNGDLYRKDAAGGKEELLLPKGNPRFPSSWSKDNFLLYTETDPKTRGDLWVLPNAQDKPGEPVKFLQTEFTESQAQFSPDGQWVAYESNESGGDEVYIRPFPSGPGKWRISSKGGREPRWRRDGKELFYLEGIDHPVLMAAPVQPGPVGVGKTGTPERLFDFMGYAIVPTSNAFLYSPAPDGQRFLVNATANAAMPTLNVMLNWEQAVAQAVKK
jgi:eukaryotic-like serine/threonine-protein kinase